MAQQKWRLLRVCFLALFCTKIICIVQGQSSSSHDAWFDVRVPLPPNATSVLGFCSPCQIDSPACTTTNLQHFYPPITGNMFSINLRINQSESLDYCYLLDDNTYEYLDVTYLECCNNEQEKCNFPSTVPAPKNCEWIPLAYIRPQFVPAEYKTIAVEIRPDSGINGNSGAVFLHATFDSDIEVAEINGVPVVGQVATTTTPSSANNKISIRLRSKVGKFVRGVISYTFKINCTQNATFSYGGSEISLFENTGNITLYTENYYTLPLSFESFQNNNWKDTIIALPSNPIVSNIYSLPYVGNINSIVAIPGPSFDKWDNPTITSIPTGYKLLAVYDESLMVAYNIEGFSIIQNKTARPFVKFPDNDNLFTDANIQFVNDISFAVCLGRLRLNWYTELILYTYNISDLNDPTLINNVTIHDNYGEPNTLYIDGFSCGNGTAYFIGNYWISKNDSIDALFKSTLISTDGYILTTYQVYVPGHNFACNGRNDVFFYNGSDFTVYSLKSPTQQYKLVHPTGYPNLQYFQATTDYLIATWILNFYGDQAKYVVAAHILFAKSTTVIAGSIVKEYYSKEKRMSSNPSGSWLSMYSYLPRPVTYIASSIYMKEDSNSFYVLIYNLDQNSEHAFPSLHIIKMPESKENVSALSFTAYTGNAANLSTSTLTLISSDDSDIQITITYNDGNLTLTQPDGTVGQNQALSESKRFDIVRASDGTFTLNSFETGNFSLSISAPPTITASSPPPPLNTTSIAPRSIVDWNQAQENEIACLPTNEHNQKCTFEYKFAELDATKGWNISLTLQRRLCSARYSMHLVNIVPENFVIQSNVWSYTMQVGECIDIIAGSARISTETLTPSHPPGISGNWTQGNFSSLCTSNKNSTLQTIYTCSNEPSLRETIIKSDCALYWNFSGLQSVNNDIHDSTKCIWYGIGDFTGISLTAGDVAVDPTTTEIYYRLTGPFLGVGTQLAKVPAKYKNIHKTSDTFPWTVGKEDGFIVSGANISSIQVNSTTYKNCPSSNPKTTLFLYSDLGDVAPPSKIYLSLNPTNDLKTLMVRPWFQWEGVEASGLPVNCADKV